MTHARKIVEVALPQGGIEQVELRQVIEELGNDFADQMEGKHPVDDRVWDKDPGW